MSNVISRKRAYKAYEADHTKFDQWKAAQRLAFSTEPLVRGTVSLGGGLIPARNYYLFH